MTDTNDREALARIVGMVLAERLPDDATTDDQFDAIRDEIVRSILAGWHRTTEPTEPVGSCWDHGPVLSGGDCPPPPPLCELPSGHPGAHRSGLTQWMTRDPYNQIVAERDALQAHLDSEPTDAEVEAASVAAYRAGANRYANMITIGRWMRAALEAARQVSAPQNRSK